MERRARGRYTAQRKALEAGRLSEDLLPREMLRKLLKDAVQPQLGGTVHTNLEWYYTNCPVRSFWSHPKSLEYLVELPMGSRGLEAYQLTAFPYQQENGDWYSLVVEEMVGFNRENGMIVHLQTCRGDKPLV